MTTTIFRTAPQQLAVRRRTGIRDITSDCAVLIRRSLRHLRRNPDEMIQTIALPIMLLLLFRYLLGGAIDTGGPSYANYLIAGVIVLSVAFSASATSVGVANDLQNGIVERFRSMPMFESGVLIAHTVSAVLRNMLSVALVVGTGLLVGFEPEAGPAEWVAALGLLLLLMVGISLLATLLGVLAGSVEAAAGYAMVLVFLPYASSALVPSDNMPEVLRVIVDNQPFTPVVDAVRALLIGTPTGDSVWLSVVWWLPISLVTAAFTIWVFRRRTLK